MVVLTFVLVVFSVVFTLNYPATVDAQVTPAIPVCGTPEATGQTGDDCFEGFVTDFNAIKEKPNVDGMLLFSPFGDNPDPNFAKHLIPGAMVTQLCGGGSCAGTKVGINPGTMYGQAGKQHPATYGFDWFLQIAERGNAASVIGTINALPANTKAVIRIGIQGNGTGFSSDPQVYLVFLREVYTGLSAEKKASTYVIAGPNEPDIEWDWFAPSCNQGLNDAFYACIGPKLASFMNAVIDGNPGFKLLSPTFNMTSYSLNGIFSSMSASGANWGGLTAISGNLYPAQVPMTQHWQTNGIDALLATAGKPLVITETGPYNCTIVGGPPKCINPDQYYIQPINGVTTITPTKLTAENPTGEQLDVIRDELIMQGYEARCAAPDFKIKLTESGRDAMEKLFKQPTINGVILGGDGQGYDGNNRIDTTLTIYSRLDVDYRDILVPLYRDLDRTDPQLKRSIEDFFGHKELNDSVYPSAELKTAAINSLLSNTQRCTVAYQNLLAQDTMCKKLADPNLCAFYATTIPNTAYTIRSLFEAYETARGERPALDFCQELMGVKDGPNVQLRHGMANAPLTIDKAYRLAFMVTSIRLRLPNPSKFLNLFTHPLGGWMGPPKPKHAVAVVAFKVPDLLTNKGFNDGYTIDTAYDDVGTLTKNSLITRPAQASIAAEARARRVRLLTKGRELANSVLADDQLEILCIGGAGVNGVGSPQCKDPLSKALVDIINAQALLAKDQASGSSGEGFDDLLDDYAEDRELKCDNKFETALTINDPGVINAPEDPSHVFAQNWGAALLANLFGDCTHDGEGNGSPSFASTQDPSTGACTGENWFLKSKFFVVQGMLAGNSDSDALAVKHFLVYPVGYELRTVESVLAGSYFTKQQLEDILELQENSPAATEKITDQFRMEGDKISFNGGEDSYSYRDVVDCPTETKTAYDPITGASYEYEEQVCPTRSFGVRLIADAAKSANILGGTLGFWMRKIQLKLNATTQKSFAYLKTCASLEEYLLDRCGGDGAAAVLPPGMSANQPADSGWIGNQCVSSTTLDEIKYNEATQLPFTGKATFYDTKVFNKVLNNRKSGGIFGNDFVGNTTVKDCELDGETFAEAQAIAEKKGQKYVGCVALLRKGDLFFNVAWNNGKPDPNAVREVWLKNSNGVTHGPFAVVDVAQTIHAPCLYDQGWAVDIDNHSFKRLFGHLNGPDQATVCDNAECSD